MQAAILAILLTAALGVQNANITNGFKVDAVGPVSIQPGEIAVITTGESTAKKYAFTVIPSSKDFYVDTGGKVAYLAGKSGTFTVVLVGIDGENVSIDTHTVTIGGPLPPTPVPPTPIPPGPTPPTPVPPGPTPPVVEGKRALLIIRESADATPAMARLITALRNPPHSVYLKDKGHTLSILDDDSVDKDGRPTPAVEAWRAQFKDLPLPVLFVIDAAQGNHIHKQSLAPTATAGDVIEVLKKFGG